MIARMGTDHTPIEGTQTAEAHAWTTKRADPNPRASHRRRSMYMDPRVTVTGTRTMTSSERLPEGLCWLITDKILKDATTTLNIITINGASTLLKAEHRCNKWDPREKRWNNAGALWLISESKGSQVVTSADLAGLNQIINPIVNNNWRMMRLKERMHANGTRLMLIREAQLMGAIWDLFDSRTTTLASIPPNNPNTLSIRLSVRTMEWPNLVLPIKRAMELSKIRGNANRLRQLEMSRQMREIDEDPDSWGKLELSELTNKNLLMLAGLITGSEGSLRSGIIDSAKGSRFPGCGCVQKGTVTGTVVHRLTECGAAEWKSNQTETMNRVIAGQADARERLARAIKGDLGKRVQRSTMKHLTALAFAQG